MIQLSALSKSFGDRVLLEAVNWQIDDRERVGLSGPNGAGKTTLLKMLAGLDEPDGGLVVKPSGLTIGYLPQDGLVHTGRTLREEAGLAFKSLLDMRAEIASLEDRLADDAVPESEHASMLTRYSDLQDEFRRGEGYSIDLKVTTVLRGDAGELSDVTSVTGGNELLQTGTPWYITVQWAVVTPEGKSTDSPITNVWGWSTDTDTGAMQLNLPPSQLGCAEAPTEGFAGPGMAHTACAAAMFEDSSVSLDQVRFVNNKAYPERDHAIKFEIPAS